MLPPARFHSLPPWVSPQRRKPRSQCVRGREQTNSRWLIVSDASGHGELGALRGMSIEIEHESCWRLTLP